MVGWECPIKPREASGLDPEAVHYRGTRSTRLDDLPPLAVLIAVAVPLYLFFPEGLPPFVALAIVVGVWTDTAIRAAVRVV